MGKPLTRQAIEEWVREVWVLLREEETPELRYLALRGSPRGPRMLGASQLCRWDAPAGGELPPASLVASTLWGEIEAVGAQEWAAVQGRAKVEGGLDLLSRQWTGPGLPEEEAPAQPDPAAPPAPVLQGYPQHLGPQMARELTVLLRELGGSAAAQARATADLAKGLAPLVQSLCGTVERQSRELVRARAAEADGLAQAARLEAVAEAAVDELASREEEGALVDRGLQALAEAVVRRIPGVDGPPSPALVLGAVQRMSDEELKKLAASADGQALLARLMALASAPAGE